MAALPKPAPPGPRHDPARPWLSLTLAISGFGAGPELRTVITDWFVFLGGRPREVLFIDGGSPPRTGRVLLSLLHDGLIDRLELLTPGHWENNFDRCYIQEYRSGLLATSRYVLFMKPDMLPYRRGHDAWLAEDLAALDDPRVFAITTTHLIDPPRSREGPYLSYDFASLNFALMKRDSFLSSLREQIGGFIDAGFAGEYPAGIDCEPRYRRALLEWAWQAHCRRGGLRTLARAESRDWTIYHVNKSGRKLLSLRRRYRARHGVEALFDRPKALYRPPPRALSRIGRTLEASTRRLRRALSPAPTSPPAPGAR